METYTHATRIVLRLFIKAKLNSESITEAPECPALTVFSVWERIISIINIQPFKAFCRNVTIFSLRSLEYAPPPSLEPCLHCMSSNHTYRRPLIHRFQPWGSTLAYPTCLASLSLLTGPEQPHMLHATTRDCPSLSTPTHPARPSLSATSSEEPPLPPTMLVTLGPPLSPYSSSTAPYFPNEAVSSWETLVPTTVPAAAQ